MIRNRLKNLKNLDEKDRKILNILQKNGRETLTTISRKVGLSIDSVNKRIKKMKESGIIDRFGIFIDPKALGYPIVADVKIKLKNIKSKELEDFIKHLKNNPNVIELISIMGDYDITCVFVAKTSSRLEKISMKVRERFSNIISDWKASIILKVHKFEEYEL